MGPLNHANVLPIYAFCETPDLNYMVTPPTDGRWLDSLLKQEGSLPLAQVRGIVREVALGLQYCHDHDVLHCDVKPKNILVYDSHVALHDFALCRRITDRTDQFLAEGDILGTPYYMSPEACQGLPLDGRSDLFSLGVTAFECLTGKRPFDGENSLEILKSAMMASVALTPPPDDVDGLFTELVMKLLAKDPGDRFQSATQLLAAPGLTGATAGTPERTVSPYDGVGKYLFLSYVRADEESANSLMDKLVAAGYNMWYDADIPGGAEWDSIIETKIRGASGLILLLSPNAVESKFVRREVKFADRLDKAIVTVELQSAQLKYGLEMLLMQYQVVQFGAFSPAAIASALGFVHRVDDDRTILGTV